MTLEIVFTEHWGPALTGAEWKAYKKKQLENINYHQDFLRIYNSLNQSELSSEVNNLINAAFGTISTSEELLGHMSFVRVEREKEKKKSTAGLSKGGQASFWKQYENEILQVMRQQVSSENQLKSKAEKLTNAKAINLISNAIDGKPEISTSTYDNWKQKFKRNNGDYIFSQ